MVRYLEFAIGRGIGAPDDQEEDEALHGPAVGMERVARRYDPDAFDGESVRTVDNSTIGPTRASSLRSVSHRPPSLEPEDIKKESCAATPKIETPADDNGPTPSAGAPRYFYGFAGEKIGQACVSWLCRWGVDILPIEEEMARNGGDDASESTGASQDGKTKEPSLVGRMRGISLSDTGSKKPAARHAHSASWTPASATPAVASSRTPPLRIWARGGLPAEWVRIVISSDAFWVRNEMERYEVAKRVVALRSIGLDYGSEEEEAREEEELALIFEKGIYYSHMVGLLAAHRVTGLTFRRHSSNFPSFLPISTRRRDSHTFLSASFNQLSGHPRIFKERLQPTAKTERRAAVARQMCPRTASR